MHNNKAGAVVLNYNTSELTAKCCRRLHESLPVENIVVVDNCSTESERAKLKLLTNEGFAFVQATRNRGYSAGNNLGIRHLLSKGVDYIFIVNPDVIIAREDVDILLDRAAEDDRALFVGPRIVDVQGQTDTFAQTFKLWNFAAVLFSKYPFSQLGLFGIKRKYYRCERDFSITEPCFSVSGCCVLFKTKYFDLFNRFDEDFFLYNEEVVWGHNAFSSGYHALYVGEATAIHDHPKNQRKSKPSTVIQRMRSNLLYLDKYLHCNRLKKELLALYYTAAYNYLSLSNPEFKERKGEFITVRRQGVRSRRNQGEI